MPTEALKDFSFRKLTKLIGRTLLPERAFATIQAVRSRKHQKQLLQQWGVLAASQNVVSQYGSTVLAGPFKGMKYPLESLRNRHSIPILFGSYECELHPAVESAISKKFSTIVDIGCAEGYYAVGLALRTGAPVIAFDCDPGERRHCKEMARLNDVAGRVTVRGWCSGSTLKKISHGRCFIVCDCEGYEFDLFSDDVIRRLDHSDLLIEIHESEGKDAKVLVERFAKTHLATIFRFDPSNFGPGVPEDLKNLGRDIRSRDQQWVYLTARN